MNGASTCITQTLKHIPNLYKTSGHFAFQYGAYDDCIADPNRHYHMIEFDVAHLTKGITMGICLPKQCSNGLVKNVLAQAFKLSGQPVYIYRVVTDPQNYQFNYSWTFFLTLAILLTFGLMVAVASLKRQRKGWQKGFALQDNISWILAKREEDLRVFDGIRVITLLWVIMGNTFINAIIGAVNVLTIDFVFRRPFILIIECALLTVDIFFALSGFFLAYKFAKHLNGPLRNYPLLILKRALRYLPAYLMTILIWYSMFMHWGNGPKWIPNQQYTSLCKNMWRTVLFIDNLVNNGHTLCMSWAFYMQIQFQVFLCSVILLFIYSKNKIASLIITIGLVAYSWTINLMYTQQNKQQYPISFKALSNYGNYIFDVFIKPHMRWTPYFFGMFVGIVYYQFVKEREREDQIGWVKRTIGGKVDWIKEKLERNRKARLGLEWGGIFIMTFVTFFPRMLQLGYQWPQTFHSMCLNFGRCLYPLAICMLITPSILGIKSSLFRILLATNYFNFLARISYGMYLVHGLVILYIANVKHHDTYFNITDLYVNSLAVIVLTVVFGFGLTVLVELPCKYVIRRIAGGDGIVAGERIGGKEGEEMKEGLLGEKKKESYSTQPTQPEEIVKNVLNQTLTQEKSQSLVCSKSD